MKRRRVLRTLGSVGGLAAAPVGVSAKQSEYPAHSTSKSLDRIGSQIAVHPSQDRAAFISAAFEPGIELYVADGVSSTSDVPSEVRQITSGTTCGSYNPEWERGNRLSFQRNLSRYTVKIPPSYKVLEHKVVKESVVDVESTLEDATVVDY